MTASGRSRAPRYLIVFTGGTISSKVSGRTFEISNPPYQLLESVPPGEAHFDVCEPFSILSENMTPYDLFHLFCAVFEASSIKIYDGILITHGTDTMAYTAQLAHLLLSGLGIPVVFIGSRLPLENPENDGAVNFENALHLLKQLKSGVYVVSRSQSGTNYVHSAGKIMQPFFDTDDFQSYKGQFAGIMQDGEFRSHSNDHPPDPPSASREYLGRIASIQTLPSPETVLVLDACPGMNFQVLPLTRREYVYILQRLYHSGTACTAPQNSPYSLLYLQELCRDNLKRLFIAPIDSDRIPYSTTIELMDAGVIPIYDLPFEAVWAGLLLCTWLEEKPEDFFGSPG